LYPGIGIYYHIVIIIIIIFNIYNIIYTIAEYNGAREQSTSVRSEVGAAAAAAAASKRRGMNEKKK